MPDTKFRELAARELLTTRSSTALWHPRVRGALEVERASGPGGAPTVLEMAEPDSVAPSPGTPVEVAQSDWDA